MMVGHDGDDMMAEARTFIPVTIARAKKPQTFIPVRIARAMCQHSNESAREPKTMVFVWVSWKKMMKLRVSSRAFSKKGAGGPENKFRGPKVTHAQTMFYRQDLRSVDKSCPSLRGRQREREAPEEGEAGGGR